MCMQICLVWITCTECIFFVEELPPQWIHNDLNYFLLKYKYYLAFLSWEKSSKVHLLLPILPNKRLFSSDFLENIDIFQPYWGQVIVYFTWDGFLKNHLYEFMLHSQQQNLLEISWESNQIMGVFSITANCCKIPQQGWGRHLSSGTSRNCEAIT